MVEYQQGVVMDTEKNVLEMTDKELQESYFLFFPDGQFPEDMELKSPLGDFKKLSFLEEAPTYYSAHSLMEG